MESLPNRSIHLFARNVSEIRLRKELANSKDIDTSIRWVEQWIGEGMKERTSGILLVEDKQMNRERDEIEMQRELNHLRSELIANVSYELKTPLGLIKVFASTMLRENIEIDLETQREFLESIQDEASKLEQLVDNLLDLGRMKDEPLRLERHATDLGQLARQITKSMALQSPNHTFIHNLPTEPILANVDARRIEQVLRNLLDNAVKYSPDGSTITVQGRSSGSEIFVQVCDQGIGIPKEHLERVFECFHRVPNDITQTTRGAGLGLAICRGIVEMHSGLIWVDSSPGQGSTFSFTLPIQTVETNVE